MDRHARFFFEVNDNFTRRFRQTYLVIGSHIVALKETFPQGFPRANETKYLVMKYQLVFFLLTFVFHRFFSVLSWTLCPKTYSARVTLNSYFWQESINLVSTRSFFSKFCERAKQIALWASKSQLFFKVMLLLDISYLKLKNSLMKSTEQHLLALFYCLYY